MKKLYSKEVIYTDKKCRWVPSVGISNCGRELKPILWNFCRLFFITYFSFLLSKYLFNSCLCCERKESKRITNTKKVSMTKKVIDKYFPFSNLSNSIKLITSSKCRYLEFIQEICNNFCLQLIPEMAASNCLSNIYIYIYIFVCVCVCVCVSMCVVVGGGEEEVNLMTKLWWSQPF